MNGRTLTKILHAELGSAFGGVYPIDEFERLPINRNTQFTAYVVNSDPAHLSGQHWLSVCTNGKWGEFFDSFGRRPQREICTFFKKRGIRNWERNRHRYQSLNSTLCGGYCIRYILARFRRQQIRMINLLSPIFQPLSYARNDVYIQKFLRKRYKLHVPIVDVPFVIDRIHNNAIVY